MTRSVDEYTDLITRWHANRPKYRATFGALVAPFVEWGNWAENLSLYYDIDVAIGYQLDVDGIWIGRSRFVEYPLPDQWFSLDDEARGMDRGVWKNESNSAVEYGLTELDDETYRRLLYAKIGANNWDGSTPGATEIYRKFFDDENTHVWVSDDQDMTMLVQASGHVPQRADLAILSAGYIPLKQAGIKMDYRVTSVEGAPLFGFDVDNEYVSGFDKGAIGVKPEWIVRYGPIDPHNIKMYLYAGEYKITGYDVDLRLGS